MNPNPNPSTKPNNDDKLKYSHAIYSFVLVSSLSLFLSSSFAVHSTSKKSDGGGGDAAAAAALPDFDDDDDDENPVDD